MTRLTRRLWVGLGAVTLASVPVAVGTAQGRHQSHDQTPAPGAATAAAADGGEAYLTDGGPRDPRIRFYRDVALMRGHLLIGGQLIELGLWDEALAHFLHPTEELYPLIEKYIALHNMRPFRRELEALAQAVKARRQGAYEQALKVVDRHVMEALAVAQTFMHPLGGFTVRSATEVLKTALSEYQSSIEHGRFVKPVEYEDSRGFVWEAERMIDAAAPELGRVDAGSLARIRSALAKLKAAWPTPMPPAVPVLEPGELSALISDIELHALRY